MSSLLDQIIVIPLFAWLLVFTRIGAAFLNLPTIGDAFVPVRVRLTIALIISGIVTPALAPRLPGAPSQVMALLMLLGGEIMIGIFLGTVARLLVSALETAGMIIATQSGLAMATVFNPMLATVGSLPGALLGWLGLALLFVTDMHHMLIAAVVDSYGHFPVGGVIPVGDFADVVARVVSGSFKVGVQIAGAFLVSGILTAFSMGLIAKLSPQIQVFFVFMSVQVALGLFLLTVTLPAMMLYWLATFESTLIGLLRPI